jgi:hypothetical protein
MSGLVIVVTCWLGAILLILACMALDLRKGPPDVKAPTRPLRPVVAEVARELGVAYSTNG